MKKKERVLVVIDGSNTYFKIRNTYAEKMDHLNFRYDKLITQLFDGKTVLDIRYYVGKIKVAKKQKASPKSEELRRAQQKLFATLEKQGIKVVHGFLLENNGTYKEKGVDVRMAVDIVSGAFYNTYDKLYVVSSDTDLIPAIHITQGKKKVVTYVGFSMKPSVALTDECDEIRVISAQDIKKCFSKPITVNRFDDVAPPKRTRNKGE